MSYFCQLQCTTPELYKVSHEKKKLTDTVCISRLILIRGSRFKRIKLEFEVFKIFNSRFSGFYPKGGKDGIGAGAVQTSKRYYE